MGRALMLFRAGVWWLLCYGLVYGTKGCEVAVADGGEGLQLCRPSLSTMNSRGKIHALNAYREGKVPALFWHVQKSGGTTMCQLAVDELRSRKCDVRAALHRSRPDCSGSVSLPSGESKRGYELLVGGTDPRKIINANTNPIQYQYQYSKFIMLDMDPHKGTPRISPHLTTSTCGQC